jgi:hypothetical protein
MQTTALYVPQHLASYVHHMYVTTHTHIKTRTRCNMMTQSLLSNHQMSNHMEGSCPCNTLDSLTCKEGTHRGSMVK